MRVSDKGLLIRLSVYIIKDDRSIDPVLETCVQFIHSYYIESNVHSKIKELCIIFHKR